MAQYYKRYKISGKHIILDWRLGGNDFVTTKDWVKDTLNGTFKWKEKVWVVPHSTAMVELLCKQGWESEEDKEARDKASCDILSDAVIGDYLPPPPIPDITKVQLDMSKVPEEIRAYQIEAVKWIEASGGSTLLAYPMGSGKAIWNESTVITPNGAKKVGDCVPGDILLCPTTGKQVSIVSTHPQPVQPLYKVTFADGRYTYCTLDHLWEVNDVYDKRGKKVVPLSHILKYPTTISSGSRRWLVELPKPCEFKVSGELPLDPYFVGYMIGNGAFHKEDKSSVLCISTKDKEIIEYVSNYIDKYGMKLVQCVSNKYDWKINHKVINWGLGINKGYVKEAFSAMGLAGTYCHTKFIPHEYKMASVADRFALLQGLIDSDGSATPKGSSYEYITVSKQLSDDFIFLVRSLGGYVTMTETIKHFTYLGERKQGMLAYRHYLTLPAEFGPVTRLARKSEKFVPKRAFRIGIESIEKVFDGHSTCFYLDSPEHMYMVDSFVPTHNTLISTTWSAQHVWDKPVLVICPAGLRKHWQNEFKQWARMKAIVAYSTFKFKSVPRNCEVIVTNFHMLAKLKDELKGNISAIIVDEADTLQNETALWSKAFTEINATATSRLFLTGTPVRNNPESIWTILKWLNPNYWNDKVDYLKRYCKMEVGYGGQVQVTDGKNLQELHSRVKPFMLYKSLEEILPDLPKINNTVYRIEADEEYAKESQAIMELLEKHGIEDISDLLDMENPDKELAAILLRIEELSRSAYKLKREKCLDFIDSFMNDSEESMLLVANHNSVVDDLKLKYNAESIDGRVNSNHRQAIVDRFNNGEKRALVINIIAGGVGFSMPNCCRMAILETTYSARDMEQLQGRIRRLTSTSHTAFYYFFIIKDSIDEKMFAAMRRKSKISSEILTGERVDIFQNIHYDTLD
jgi:superfamily II DNA or RNA helicase